MIKQAVRLLKSLMLLLFTITCLLAEDGYNYPNNKKGIWITPLIQENSDVPLNNGDTFTFKGDVCTVKWGSVKENETCHKMHYSQVDIRAFFPDGATDVTDKLVITPYKDKKSFHFSFTTDELNEADLNQFSLVISSNHNRSSKLISIKSKLGLRIELINGLIAEYQGDSSKEENIIYLESLKEKLARVNSRIEKALDANPEILARYSYPLQVENAKAAPLYYASNFSGHKMAISIPNGIPVEGEPASITASITNLSHLNYSFPSLEMDGGLSESDYDAQQDQKDKTMSDEKELYVISLSLDGSELYSDSTLQVPFGESWSYTIELANADPNLVNAIDFQFFKNRVLKSNNAKREDKKYGSLNTKMNVSFDDIAPIIIVNSPDSNIQYVQDYPSVEAIISDSFGRINPESISANINGVDFTNSFSVTKIDDGQEYILSADINGLPEGSYIQTLSGSDYAGNEASHTLQEIIIDKTPPVLSSSLADGILTNISMLKLPITVVDSSPIQVFINHNGSALPIEELYSFEKDILLNEGLNTFDIYAIDAAGNKSNDLNFSNIVLDTIPPVLSNINPANGAANFEVEVEVSGLSNEKLSQVAINNTEIAVDTDGLSFSGIFNAFTEGVHEYTITAYDLVGNETSVTRSVEVILNVINIDLITIIPLDDGRLLIKGAPNSIRPNTEFTISRGFFSSDDLTSKSDGSFEYVTALFSEIEISAFNIGKNEEESYVLTYDLDTTLSGTILDIYDNPIPGVLVRIESSAQSAFTNAQGVFTIPEPITGDQKLIIDGGSVPEEFLNGEKKYFTTAINVNIGLNQKNILQEPIYLSHMPTDGSEIQIDATTSVSVTSPHAPGVVLNIPSGITTLPDGATTGAISVMEIPSDKTSVPPLEVAVPNTVYSFEPSGTKFSEPVELVLPNVNEFPAGLQMVILSKNSLTGSWEIDGLARVSDSGAEIVTEPGQGITHFSDVYAAPLGPTIKEIEPEDKVGSDLLSGSLNTEVALPTFKSLNQDIAIGLNYKSRWANPVTVVSNMFDIPRQEQKLDPFIVGKKRSLVPFEQLEITNLTSWIEPDYIEAQFFSGDIVSQKMNFTGVPNKSVVSYAMDLGSLESGIYPYQSKYKVHLKQMILGTKTTTKRTSLFGSTKVYKSTYNSSKAIDQVFPSDIGGALKVQNKRNSPYGSGWDLNLVGKITNPNGSRILIEEANGATAQYIINDTIETLYSTTQEMANASFSSWPIVVTSDGNDYIEKLEEQSGQLVLKDNENVDFKLRGEFSQGMKVYSKFSISNQGYFYNYSANTDGIWCSNDKYSFEFDENVLGTILVNGRLFLSDSNGQVRSKKEGSYDFYSGTYGIADKNFDIHQEVVSQWINPIFGDPYIGEVIVTKENPDYFSLGAQKGRCVNKYGAHQATRFWHVNQYLWSANACDPVRFCMSYLQGKCTYPEAKKYIAEQSIGGGERESNYSPFAGVWYWENFFTGHVAVGTTQPTCENDPDPIGTTTNGKYPVQGFADGVNAKFNNPTTLIQDLSGNIVVADTGNNRVRLINASTKFVTTIAGNGQNYDNGNGSLATQASLFHPKGLAYDLAGNLYITTENGFIRKVDTTGRITTFAGKLAVNGGVYQDYSHASDILLDDPNGLVVDNDNNYLYVADTGHHRVLRIDLFSKETVTVAGSGSCDSSETFENKAALDSSLCNPTDIGLDEFNNLLILDNGHKKIRRVKFSNTGTATTFLSVTKDHSTLNRNNDGTFTRKFRDGSVMSYNSKGQQTYYTNRTGVFINYSYSNDLLSSITDAVGQTINLTYNNGKIQSITDPAGRTTTFNIVNGKLISVLFPDNTTLGFEYNGLGLLEKEINQRGFETSYTYNKWRRLDYVTRSDGSVINVNNGVETTIGNDYTGGSKGELKGTEDEETSSSIVDEKGNITTFKMDEFGFVSQISVEVAGEEKTTTIERSDSGKPLKIEDSDGNVTTFKYSENEYEDLVEKVDGETGITDQFVYNQYGQLITSTRDGVQKVFNDYDLTTGTLLSRTNEYNKTESFVYYDFGILKEKINFGGFKTTYEYDDHGNLSDTIDHLGNRTTITRDAAGNPTSIELPESTKLADGDPGKKKKQLGYTQFNLLAYVISPEGQRTDYKYLATGELSNIIDPNLKMTLFEYDGLGRLTKETNTLNQFRTLAYDTSGNVTQEVGFSGIEKSYEYDDKNRLTKSTLPDNIYTFSYNDDNNITRVKNNTSQIDYTYKKIDKEFYVDSETVTGLGSMSDYPKITFNYTLNDKAQRTSMVTPFGNFGYDYDSQDRLEKITNHKAEEISFTYDDLNRLETITRPGSTTTYSFDETSFLTGIEHKKAGSSDFINNIIYSRDANANRIEKTSFQGLESYSFDANNFLKSVTSSEFGNENYDYDELGNRTTDSGGSYTYDNEKRELVEDYRYKYFYDAQGNLSSKVSHATIEPNVPTETIQYSHNSENQLSAILTYSGNDLIKEVRYYYDARSRRMAKAINYPLDETKNYERKYIYQGNEILAQLDGDNKTLAVYTHSTLRTDDVLAVDFSSDAVTQGLSKSIGSHFYIKDGLGSITDIVNSNGEKLQSYFYSAFGELRDIKDSSDISILDDPNISPYFTFTNREYDDESGLYYYRARYYDSSIGRFIQVDPHPGEMTSPHSMTNKYIYAQNNPVMHTDPSGKFIFGLLLGAFSIATDTNYFENLFEVVKISAVVIASMYAWELAAKAITEAVAFGFDLGGGALGGATSVATATVSGIIAGAAAGGLAGGISGGLFAMANGGSFRAGFESGFKLGMIAGGVLGAFSGIVKLFDLASVGLASGGPCAGKYDKVLGGIILVLIALYALKKLWDIWGDDLQKGYDKLFKKNEDANNHACGSSEGVYT